MNGLPVNPTCASASQRAPDFFRCESLFDSLEDHRSCCIKWIWVEENQYDQIWKHRYRYPSNQIQDIDRYRQCKHQDEASTSRGHPFHSSYIFAKSWPPASKSIVFSDSRSFNEVTTLQNRILKDTTACRTMAPLGKLQNRGGQAINMGDPSEESTSWWEIEKVISLKWCSRWLEQCDSCRFMMIHVQQ